MAEVDPRLSRLDRSTIVDGTHVPNPEVPMPIGQLVISGMLP